MIEGTVLTTTPVREMREEWQPTLANLCKHFDRYGLDNAHETSGSRGLGKPVKYKTFKALSQDSIVMTGQAYLGQEAFVQLVEHVGYSAFAAEARAHWASLRGEG